MKIRITLCAIIFAALAITPREALASPSVGDREHYTFRIAGKVIGTQSAQLISVGASSQTWMFALNLKVPMGGNTKTLTQTGTLVVANDGTPISLATKVALDSQVQDETLTFGKGKVDIALKPSISSIPPSLPTSGPSYLVINNIITSIAIILRANRPPLDKPTSLQMFSANILQPGVLTLTPSGHATIKSRGQMVACHIFDASPIQERFWVSDTTGDLVMDASPTQKLEITYD